MSMYMIMHTHTRARTHAHTRTCTHTRTRTHARTHAHEHTSIHRSTCTCLSTRQCLCFHAACPLARMPACPPHARMPARLRCSDAAMAAVLRHCDAVVLPWHWCCDCDAAVLRCYAAMLRCCDAVMLQCCHAAMLRGCDAAMLRCCDAAMLPCCDATRYAAMLHAILRCSMATLPILPLLQCCHAASTAMLRCCMSQVALHGSMHHDLLGGLALFDYDHFA